MALEDMDPRHLLDDAMKQMKQMKEQVDKLTALLKRQQSLMKITIDLSEKLNDRNTMLKGFLKEAYDEGRQYPYDEAGSSFDRWLAKKIIHIETGKKES